jgi:uncharacterized protein YjbI with pentapeptide repeats
MAKKKAAAGSSSPSAAGALAGKSFCTAGKLQAYQAETQVQRLVGWRGGRLSKKVDVGLDYLVLGQTGFAGAKKEADKLNQRKATIQIIDESDFFRLLSPTRDELIALLTGGKPGIEMLHSLLECYQIIWPDLKGADLRAMVVPAEQVHLSIERLNLSHADLRGAELHNSWFGPLDGANLDGATFQRCHVRGSFAGCKVRKAQCRGSSWSSGILDSADFSGARVVRGEFRRSKGRSAVFAGTDLSGAEFAQVEFDSPNFANADLTGADFNGAKLKKANFARAKLLGATLTDADLKEADFTNADLRDADLTAANLQATKLDGANLAGASLQGAKVDARHLAKANGLDAKAADLASRFGPKIQELDQLARLAREIVMEVSFGRTDGETKVGILTDPQSVRASWGGYVKTEKPDSRQLLDSKSLATVMVSLGHRFKDAQFQFDALTVKSTKSAISGKPLKALALAAWCEALGVPQPDEAALAAQKASRQTDLAGAREKYLALLRGGPKGIKEWNGLAYLDRETSHYREFDLAKANLTGALLRNLDFRKANLAGADLRKATLSFSDLREADLAGAKLDEAKVSGAKCGGANLANATLKGAWLDGVSFKQANLAGADLSAARVEDADLCGADLTGATLDRVFLKDAKYDEATKWPQGFADFANLKWAGQGLNPAIVAAQAQRKSAGPIDLATFLSRLEEAVEKARLDKAVSMLKADRFRLFAEVKPDSVTGVVKSQTDPELVYSCRLAADGSFACCTQNLNVCGGLRGALCKHLLVLIIGLTKAGELDPTTVDGWIATSRLQKPALQKDLMSETFLRYKGAEAGEIDWRPTETIPEDYYAM